MSLTGNLICAEKLPPKPVALDASTPATCRNGELEGVLAMQQGPEVAQKCTESESLPDRDGCPHRAGLRVRYGQNFGCRGATTGRRVRRTARKLIPDIFCVHQLNHTFHDAYVSC